MAFFLFFFYTFFPSMFCFTRGIVYVGIKAGTGKSKAIKYYRPFGYGAPRLLFVGSVPWMRLNECIMETRTLEKLLFSRVLIDDAGPHPRRVLF